MTSDASCGAFESTAAVAVTAEVAATITPTGRDARVARFPPLWFGRSKRCEGPRLETDLNRAVDAGGRRRSPARRHGAGGRGDGHDRVHHPRVRRRVAHLPRAGAGLPRAHRGVRQARTGAECADHRESPGAGRRRCDGRRVSQEPDGGRSVALRARRAQGQLRHRRPADDRRVALAGGIASATGRVHRAEAARRRRAHPGQGQSAGAGDGRQHRQLARRADAQPVRPHPYAGRIERWDRRSGRRGPGAGRHRQRYRTVDPIAGLGQQSRRHPADARVGQPARHHPGERHPGRGRADRAHRRRRGAATRRDGRLRSRGSDHRGWRRSCAAHVHGVPRPERLARCPHRRAARATSAPRRSMPRSIR